MGFLWETWITWLAFVGFFAFMNRCNVKPKFRFFWETWITWLDSCKMRKKVVFCRGGRKTFGPGIWSKCTVLMWYAKELLLDWILSQYWHLNSSEKSVSAKLFSQLKLRSSLDVLSEMFCHRKEFSHPQILYQRKAFPWMRFPVSWSLRFPGPWLLSFKFEFQIKICDKNQWRYCAGKN